MNKKAALQPLITNLIVIVLGAFFMLMFIYNAIQIGDPNSTAVQEMQNYTGLLNNSISSFSATANSVSNMMGDKNQTSPSPTSFLFLIFENAFWIPIKFLGLVGSVMATLGMILIPSLNGSTAIIVGIVVSIITSVIIIEIVLAIIKSIRTGESER